MKKYLTISILFLLQRSQAQDFNSVSLTTAEKNGKQIKSHYSTKFGTYSGADLYLFNNGKFSYRDYTHLSNRISSGFWTINQDTVNLKGEFGTSSLPVKVTYLKQPNPDIKSNRFTVLRDLNNREYGHTAIHINHDSVSCFYGDMECFGTYKSIDSIKVKISDEVSSGWIKVDTSKGIIQVTLQTDIELERYFPLNLRLKKEKSKLKYIK